MEVITSLPIKRSEGRGTGREVVMMSLLFDMTVTEAKSNCRLKERAPAGWKACLNTLHVF